MRQSFFAFFLSLLIGFFLISPSAVPEETGDACSSIESFVYFGPEENFEAAKFSVAEPEVQFAEGQKYLNGEGVEKDEAKAAEIFLMAARQGYIPAYEILSELYAEGRGVEQDDEISETFTELAKEMAKYPKGEKTCEEKQRKGVFDDLTDPTLLLRYATQYNAAKYQFALRRFNGDFDRVSYNDTYIYLLQASAKGYAAAQADLGLFLFEDYLVFRNMDGEKIDNQEEALKWVLKAVEQGNPKGFALLARFYKEGYAVEKNLELAEKYQRFAEILGFSGDQMNLGNPL